MALVLDGNGDITGLVAGALEANAIGTGAVRQVVQGTSGTRVQVSSSSYTDVNPSVSITPSSSSSKILVVAAYSIGGYSSTNINGGSVQILRGSTSIAEFSNAYSNQAALGFASELRSAGVYSFIFLDSPSTTSSVTYKLQMKKDQGDRIESPGSSSGALNVLTLMEIAG